MRTLEGRMARAKRYAQMLEARQGTYLDRTLISLAPFKVVRTISVSCTKYGRYPCVLVRQALRAYLKEGKCDGQHALGNRMWAVAGSQTGVPELGIEPVFMELFNDVLMAKALCDDLNTKAGFVIMRKEAGT